MPNNRELRYHEFVLHTLPLAEPDVWRKPKVDLLPNWDPSQKVDCLLPNYEQGMAAIDLIDAPAQRNDAPTPR